MCSQEIYDKVVCSGVQWVIVGVFRTYTDDPQANGGDGAMFLGEHQHRLDEKHRLIVPAKFRDLLGETFIMTRGLDACLFVYPLIAWHALVQQLKKLPMMNADARAFTRYFFAGAVECALDKQGRIVIPDHLRSHARLDKSCLLIGVSERVEIWDQDGWATYQATSAPAFEQLAEQLIGGSYGV